MKEGLNTVEDDRERSRLSKENGDKYYEPELFRLQGEFFKVQLFEENLFKVHKTW